MVKAQQDALDAFVAAANKDPMRAIQVMLWNARLQEPDMYVKVTEADLKGLADCVAYLKVKPAVRIHREAGLPAQPAIPAAGNRRAVPARPATDAKPFAVIALVEMGKDGQPSGNTIKPVENNEEDYDRSLEIAAVRRARDMAPDLATRLLNASRTGDFSSSDLQEAGDALVRLARAVQA
jgi:hypothetical protein